MENDLKYSTHPRVVFEAAAMRASMPEQDYNIDALLARIAKLEKAVAEGVKVTVEKVEKSTKPEEKKVDIDEEKVLSAKRFDERKSSTEPYKDDVRTEKINAETIVKPETEKINTETTKKPVKIVDDDFYGAVPPEEDLPFNSSAANTIKQSAAKSEDKPLTERKDERKIQVPEMPETKKDEDLQTHTSLFDKKAAEEKPKIVISGARMWGTVVRRLRADKNIMLWIACQDLEAKTEGNKLCIIAEGDNEYNLIKKPENLAILQNIVSETSDYKVVVYHGEEVKESFDVLGPIEEED